MGSRKQPDGKAVSELTVRFSCYIRNQDNIISICNEGERPLLEQWTSLHIFRTEGELERIPEEHL